MSNSFATPWTIARQAPLFMGFPRQEYWSGLPFPSPEDLPNPQIKPMSFAFAGGFFTIWATREANLFNLLVYNCSWQSFIIFVFLLDQLFFFTPKPRFSGQILTIHRNSLLALYWIHHWGIRALDRFSLQRTWKCSHDTFKSWKRANVTLFQHRGLS